MACKRSRVARSPSWGEVALHPQAIWGTEQPTIDSRIVAQNATLNQERPPRKSTLSSGLPTNDLTRTSSPGFGEFLQACSLCKKKITARDIVYMYGYLSAYCSPECREHQIILDRLRAAHYSRSRKMA